MLLSAEAIAEKVNGYKQGDVPAECEVLTAFVDVQMDLLYYLVVAWQKETFSGFVIDYGAYPDQGAEYFTTAGVKQTLAIASRGAGLEGSIYAGLDRLTGDLLTKDWRREDGGVVRIDRLLIDANWGRSTDTVYKFVRNSTHAANLTPSHGVKDSASSLPFDQYKWKRGDVIGDHWRKPSVQAKRAVRHVIYPANYWKSFVQARLATAMGDRGCLSLFKAAPRRHRMLAEHLTAEFAKETQGSGRVLQEWFLRPGFDNHLLDCLVGAAVAASMEGGSLMGDGQAERKRKKLNLIELREKNRRNRRR
ncbi:MAG: hypothetical protein RIC55_09095 [Pirellulaceae bacterium]